MPWDPGLFLLDVESGEVEGWIRPEGDAISEQGVLGTVSVRVRLSPSNRFLEGGLMGTNEVFLHDRLSGRTYAWDGGAVVAVGGALWELIALGSGSEEMLVFWVDSIGTYVVADGAMQPAAQLELPGASRSRLGPLDANGRYITALAAHPDQTPHFFVHFLDLEMDHGATVTPSSTRALAWHPNVWGKGLYQTHAFEGGIALSFPDATVTGDPTP